MTKNRLRVLYIEDSDFDADLVEAQLGLQEFAPEVHRVETAEEMRAALGGKAFDVVLADYSLPTFSAVAALEIMHAADLDYPFIVVSGTIGEKRAIEILKAGAQDFISKGDFARLIPAIRRELADAESREARRAVERALSISEDNFRELADAMPQLVWVTIGGLFTYLNAKWREYFGAEDGGEVSVESWLHGCVHPEDRETARSRIQRSTDALENFEMEVRLKRVDGQYRWFLARGVPSARASTTSRHQLFGTFTDIEDAKRKTEQELAERAKSAAESVELYRRAEAANQAKTDFLANMSHEIRTPLAAILGFADLMSDSEVTEEERQNCIEVIKRNGRQLAHLIDEILDLTKVEAQHLELEVRVFSLKGLVTEVVTLLGRQAQQKGLELVVEIEASCPDQFLGDATRIRQILINLVGNAIKFTGKGSVKLAVSAVPVIGNVELRFAVTDTGIGLNDEQKQKLFHPFVQADSSMTRKFGGTGLGLALSRRLARALGGDVVIAQSELGKGSTFVATIRAVVNNDAELALPIPTAQKPVSAQVLANLRVLVVDDAPDNRVLVTRYLTKAGAVVETAADGLIGVERALTENFDVVLMDLQMPGTDGFQALKLLKARGYHKPVIALTAHAMRGDRERCLEAGFTAHLSKPIDAPNLIQLLSQL